MQAEFIDRILTCMDCQNQFVFTAGEQIFFLDKQFKNDPKRCKPCKAKRSPGATRLGSVSGMAVKLRMETRTKCSECNIETTVPFKPTQGRPVLCRLCFQGKRASAMREGSAATVIPNAGFSLTAAIEAMPEDTVRSVA